MLRPTSQPATQDKLQLPVGSSKPSTPAAGQAAFMSPTASMLGPILPCPSQQPRPARRRQHAASMCWHISNANRVFRSAIAQTSKRFAPSTCSTPVAAVNNPKLANKAPLPTKILRAWRGSCSKAAYSLSSYSDRGVISGFRPLRLRIPSSRVEAGLPGCRGSMPMASQ